jgi:hypothetical protein
MAAIKPNLLSRVQRLDRVHPQPVADSDFLAIERADRNAVSLGPAGALYQPDRTRAWVSGRTEVNEWFERRPKAMTVTRSHIALLGVCLLVACTRSLPADDRSSARSLPSNIAETGSQADRQAEGEKVGLEVPIAWNRSRDA